MFKPRKTARLEDWSDPDGLKVYTISATGEPVAFSRFVPRLVAVKDRLALEWKRTAAFSIFHEGASMSYLVVGWWGNDNELFTSVSAAKDGVWTDDPNRYSFCIWDLEVIWHERNSFIRHVYVASPDMAAYREDYLKPIEGIRPTSASDSRG